MSNAILELSYKTVLRVGRLIHPNGRNLLYQIGLAVSPSMALADEEQRRHKPMLRSTLALAALVWLFSLGFNAFFSALNGRFLPDANPQTINLLEDTWNLTLYALICPAYVALSLQIVMVSSRFEGFLTRAPGPPSRVEASRSPLALSLCIAIAAAFAAKYVVDVAMGPGGLTYWFNDRVGDLRVLNAAGVYYALMTFGFLSVTLLALLNYLSIAQSSVKLADSLTPADFANPLVIQVAFRRFKRAYVFARWLIAIFMIHTVIWSRSPLAKTDNIHIAGVLLVLAAVFLTALPALHLDKKLAAAAQEAGVELGTLEIEPVGAKKWLPLADAIIGVGFISSLWGWEPIADFFTMLFGERQL